MANKTPTIELRPLRVQAEELERLEKEIKKAFREVLYQPLMHALHLSPSMIMNAKSAVSDALRRGLIRFDRGNFRGTFSAAVSRELIGYGAVWDKRSKSFQIARSDLPGHIQAAIDHGEEKFTDLIGKVTATLAKILPEKISRLIDSVKIFENILAKSDDDFQSSLKNLTVAPKLSKEAKARIASEWRDNLDLYIKDFLDSEIIELRNAVQKSTMAGNRFEALVSLIQKSYGVTERKAHFLARQETNLLLSKFKETRYTEAGIKHYKWKCVVGSPAHPVRPSHLALDGKIFRWDDPPITTAKGEPIRRNNPGQDYNCRCMAIPIIK